MSGREDWLPVPDSGIGWKLQRFLRLDDAIRRAANKAADQAVAKALEQMERSLRQENLELKASIEQMRAATEAVTTHTAEHTRNTVHAVHAALDARGTEHALAISEHLTDHVSAQSEAVKARLEALLLDQLAYMREAMAELIAAGQTELLRQIHDQLSHVDAHLSAHLSKELSLQLGRPAGAKRSGNDPALLQRRLVTLGRLLQPVSARGVPKLRLGHRGDGGYVMLDDFSGVEFALSLGVGAEMTWDKAMADRGIEIHQFDYTIEAPPETHERIHFHRSRIVPVQDGADHSLSSAQRLGNERACIIKMDIEGDEWSVLDAAGAHDFDRVTQLVIELHDFERVGNDEWFARAERVLQRLAGTFCVVHVHANNNGLFGVHGNVAFPEILEVTFANRSRYEFEPLTETFPTALDAPNRDDLPDIVLGTFRF